MSTNSNQSRGLIGKIVKSNYRLVHVGKGVNKNRKEKVEGLSYYWICGHVSIVLRTRIVTNRRETGTKFYFP